MNSFYFDLKTWKSSKSKKHTVYFVKWSEFMKYLRYFWYTEHVLRASIDSLRSLSRLNEITDQYKYPSHCAHVHSQKKKNPSNMSCCDVITFHLMWKIIQSQWDGKCSAVYHRKRHCLLPTNTSFALSRSHNYSLCLTVIHIPQQSITACLI